MLLRYRPVSDGGLGQTGSSFREESEDEAMLRSYLRCRRRCLLLPLLFFVSFLSPASFLVSVLGLLEVSLSPLILL